MRELRVSRCLGTLAAAAALFAFGAQALRADVVLTDKQQIQRQQSKLEKKTGHRSRPGSTRVGLSTAPGRVVPLGTSGNAYLIDASGLEWFLNTDITYTTSSSASGAMSDATYTTSVQATTSSGSSTWTTLSDAFDGYNALAVNFVGHTGPATTGDPFIIFNQNGPPTIDPDSGGREYLFNTQNAFANTTTPGPAPGGGLAMWRKVYVPSDDSFARWLNFFRNDTAEPITVTMVTSNNLGSDTYTIIFGSSDGDKTASLTDTWVGTMQDYNSGGGLAPWSGPMARWLRPTDSGWSPDPRLAHVMQGTGNLPVPLADVLFEDDENNPYWAYTMTIPAGETYCIMNFAVAQPSKAAAAAKAVELVGLPEGAVKFMSDAEKSQVKNFLLGNEQTLYWISIKSNGSGSTDPQGAFQVPAGTNLSVKAYPDTGWRFQSWTGIATGASNPVTFTVDRDYKLFANFVNAPPTVQITSPLEGQGLSGTVPVTATAADDTGVAKVEFYVDGALKAADAAAPYAFDWDITGLAAGAHLLKAVAYDAGGLTGSHQITVYVANVTLALAGSRMSEQAWAVVREYARLAITVTGTGTGAVQKYILYRKSGSAGFAAIKELTAAEVGTSLVYYDKYLAKGVGYTYKLVAVIGGAELAVSNEVAL